MQFFHSRVQTVGCEQRHNIGRLIDVLRYRGFNITGRTLKYVGSDSIFITRVTNAETQAHELLSTMLQHVPNSVVAAMPAALFQANSTRRQVYLVVGHQQLRR